MQTLGLWFWRLLPANPLVVRIVQGGSQRMRHLWVRMGYLGALIGLVLVGLLRVGGLLGEASLTELAKAGSHVFETVSYGQIILVCLLAPLFMAGAIGQERAGETFDILLTTPLSNLQIVLGSLVGRLFFVLALLLSGLPLFAVLLIFGGVPIRAVFVAFTVAGLTALLVGAVAVTLSVFRAGGRKAVFAFVIAIAAYLIVAYVLDFALLRRLPGSAVDSTTWLTPLHPLLVLEASLHSANYRAPGPEVLANHMAIVRFYLGQPFGAFAVLSVLISALLIVGSALIVRTIGQGNGLSLTWLRRRLRLSGDGGGERRRRPRVVWQNPVAWREASTRGNRVGGILARWGFAAVALTAAIVLVLLYHTNSLPVVPSATTGQRMPSHEVFRQALSVLLVLDLAVVTLVAIHMSASCVSREREDATLDLILATPITPKQYIWGKLRGLVSFLGLLIAVPVLTFAMVSVYALLGKTLGWDQATFLHSSAAPQGARMSHEPLLMLPEAPVLFLLMLVPFVALCVTAGMNWSLKAKGVLGAVVPTLAIIGALMLVMGPCGWGAAERMGAIGSVINSFSPATNLFMLINPWDRINGFAQSPLLHRFYLFIGAICACGGYSIIVYALLMGMVKDFDQTVRRLSGTG